jgi:hypothetical protein
MTDGGWRMADGGWGMAEGGGDDSGAGDWEDEGR